MWKIQNEHVTGGAPACGRDDLKDVLMLYPQGGAP